MTVQELQKKLDKLDPKLDVICYCEKKLDMYGSVVMDVIDITSIGAERVRIGGRLYLKFNSDDRRSIALIKITTDF
jgi:hypothetical protein